jgi:hypothetical protein
MTVLGVYIFFLTPPFASFHTIARRAKEGTLTSERLIPVPAGIFLLGKIKVMALTGLKLSWPVFLLAWIGDPTLRFSSKYLMLSFYLMPTPGIISPIVLFLIGIFFLLVFWMCLASIVVRVAFEGKSLAELLGRYIFWGLIILLALGWAVSALVPVRTAIFPGFGGMVLTASAVFLGFAFLIFRESLRWLESGE